MFGKKQKRIIELEKELIILHNKIDNLEKESSENLSNLDQTIDQLETNIKESDQLSKINMFLVNSINNVSSDLFALKSHMDSLMDAENKNVIIDYDAIQNLIESIDKFIQKFDVFYMKNVNAETKELETNEEFSNVSLPLKLKYYADSNNPYEEILKSEKEKQEVKNEKQ